LLVTPVATTLVAASRPEHTAQTTRWPSPDIPHLTSPNTTSSPAINNVCEIPPSGIRNPH